MKPWCPMLTAKPITRSAVIESTLGTRPGEGPAARLLMFLLSNSSDLVLPVVNEDPPINGDRSQPVYTVWERVVVYVMALNSRNRPQRRIVTD